MADSPTARLTDAIGVLAATEHRADPATAVAVAITAIVDAVDVQVCVEVGGSLTVARVVRGSRRVGDVVDDGVKVEIGSWRGSKVFVTAESATPAAELVEAFAAAARLFAASAQAQRLAQPATARREDILDHLVGCLGFHSVQLIAIARRSSVLARAGDAAATLELDQSVESGRGIVARALRTKRTQYADSIAGVDVEPAIAVPLLGAGTDDANSRVLVLRGRSERVSVLPYELELAEQAAELVGAEYGHEPASGSRSETMVQHVVADMIQLRDAGSATLGHPEALLSTVAGPLIDSYDADLVWISLPDGNSRLISFAGAGPETVEIPAAPSLADDLGSQGLIVDRTTQLRGVEEAALDARGLLSYACVPIPVGSGPSAALGIAAKRFGAFRAASLDGLGVLGYLAGLVVAAERAGRDEVETRRRLAVSTSLATRMLTVLGHQFRTPLTVLRGFTSMLRDERVSVDATVTAGNKAAMSGTDVIAGVTKSSAQLERLVDNVTLYAELTLGRYETVHERVDADDVVSRAIDAATSNKSRVVRQLRASVVDLDATALRHIVVNLVDNAARYTDGEIRIRTTVDAGDFLLEVADTGPGIEHADRDRVLSSFSSDADPANPSVGLGLTITDRLARASGGELVLADAPGGGLSARVILPIGAGGARRARRPDFPRNSG